ncbi:dTDP-4-dehydrorhamnose reductase [Cladophialophora bantiana CBS 173.52]|uniref:dTDP-4-dehydrorhamnose reductase n=1 Tax=Cladophialophora bantiana (strain ATCC 10958 / CBS 173.52 / CDC B-1940 / NIH 8579) TaxID=1442370 RepID=A0A0D2HYT5_CLAB1|nr:dTDP-4-dehydrorhamnose reductase [Cladophialophora bantiana CBS 173.52]KIW98623.1 dTDP-4-dehydrorhamnose reductase [Cladophialophora bantiana CBS 173.52]
MPSVLVTGASGFLGRQVLKAFSNAGWNATGTGFSRASETVRKVDLQDADAVAKLFDQVKPQVVVHCAADRQPDSCTRNPEAAHKLNVTATEILASCAAKHDAFLIYISTDYVFPGIQGQAPYKTTDTPRPTNIYGQTKLDGETAVLQCPNSTVVLRVPVLYGPTSPKENNKESAVNVLMDSLWKSQNEKVKMDDWAIRYPTNVEDVARVCLDIAKLYTASPHPENLPRILQFSSEDRMTKYGITQKFAEIMGLSLDGIVPDKEGGKPGPDGTLRPYDCHLDTSELQKLGIDVSTVDFVAWWRRWVGAYRH